MDVLPWYRLVGVVMYLRSPWREARAAFDKGKWAPRGTGTTVPT